MMPALHRFLLSAAIATFPLGALVAQQSALVTGRVTNTLAAPLSGAQVSVPSLGIGATTRGDGSYTVLIPVARIPSGPVTVTARLIGYKLASIEVTLTSGSTKADFTLADDPLRLGEVVVTGAGTVSEVEKLGTVRNSIDSATIVRANEQNLVSALAAKAPNVSVFSSSGDPGASAYIQIRGLTSISSSDGQPLFVVDGLPMDNSTTFNNPAQIGANGASMFPPNRLIDLNPDDIENIEILKGPSSAALYGSRAGQGVVLITTKHGRPGETRYSLRSSWSLDQHTQLPHLQRQFGLGSGGVRPSCVPGPDSPAPDLNNLNCFVGFEDAGSWGPAIPAGTPPFDHASDIFQNGYATDNALNVSGGSESTQFFLSGAYSYNRGFVVGDNAHYRRISVRLNGSQQVTDRLKVGANVAYSNGSGGFVVSRNARAGVTLGSWRTPPEFNNLPYLDPVFGLQRSYRFPNPGPGSEQLARGFDNPFFIAHENPATSNVSRTFGVINGEWSPTSWLKFNETLGLDYSNDERFQAWAWSNSEFLPPNGATGVGAVNAGYTRDARIDHNLTATLSYSVSPQFKGTVTVGQNLSSLTSQSRQTLGVGLITPQPFNLANTTTTPSPVYDFYQKVHLESYFGQTTADLWDQLYLTAGVRNDGVSSFGPGSQRNWFPRASAAWVFYRGRNENKGFITYGKLRAAYGQSGTQPPPYLLSSIFSPTAIQVPGVGGLVTGGDLRNPNLGPERVKELEGGLDLGLFGDRADLSVTHYRQNSHDVILEIPVALSLGYSLQEANAGSLQNRGWEVSLNLRPVTTRSFAWEVGLQWARNRGITTSLASGVRYVQLPFQGGGGGAALAVGGVAQAGQPIAAYRGTDFARCGRGLTVDGIDVDNTPGHCHGAPAGALYIAADGYPRGDFDSTYVLADPNPDWTGSLRTNFRIGKLSLGGLLDIRHGGISYNGTKGALQHFGIAQITADTRNAAPVAFGTDYYPSNVNATPVAGPGVGVKVRLDEGWWTGLASVFNGVDAAFLEKGQFVKLREISIGYTLDQRWVSRSLGFSSIELRVAGRNLASWNDYTGVDPETSLLGAATVVRGFDYFNNPQTRSWVFTLTLNR
jgi:TonB-linked SusC/RagA family outer membrane protein